MERRNDQQCIGLLRRLLPSRRKNSAYEFFLFQLRLQVIRRAHRQDDGNQILYNNQELKKFIKTIPFELTDAQKRSVMRSVATCAPYQTVSYKGTWGQAKQSFCAGNCGHGQCWLSGCFDGADRILAAPNAPNWLTFLKARMSALVFNRVWLLSGIAV